MVGKTVCFVVKMKAIVTSYLFCLIGLTVVSQHQNQLYKGNQSYMDGDFDQAQMYYQQALSGDPNIYEGNLNLGNTNFRKQDFEGAISLYQKATENSIDAAKKAKALHNLGNTYLQNQKIDEAIEAYKSALRANPNADETRYNLAYAQKLKKQQQEQQNQDQNKDQENEEKNEDQQEKKDDKKDNQEKQQDQKEEDKEQQDKKDQQDQQEQKDNKDQQKDQEQKAQPKPIELSPREAEQMLEAAKNEDQKLQMQLRKQQAKTKNIDKDW